jgi:hypothetical protein
MSCNQDAEQDRDIKIVHICRSFENVAKFRYLGTAVTNQNLDHKEIKSTLKSGNACSYSVQSLLLPRLMSKHAKIRIHETIIFSLVLYGCETWYLTLREEHRVRVFESRLLSRMFGQKRDEIIGNWRKLHSEDLHKL